MQYADPVLQRFFDSLGSKPFYMKQKKSRCSIANREIAVRYRYIQLNQRRRAYIVLDIDHERGAQAIEDAGLPVPTMVIHKRRADPSDPKPNSVHVYYELTAPVSDGPRSRTRPLRFLEAVTKKLLVVVRADLAYRGFIAKNPLSPEWSVRTCDVTYELSVLAEYVHGIAMLRLKENVAGRNVTLFDSVRAWVAKAIRNNGHAPDLNQVWDAAMDLNLEFEQPLPASEVKSIARSITLYAERHRCVSQLTRHRGAMGLACIEAAPGTREHTAETRRRQREGGRLAASRRAAKNEARVRNAIATLQSTRSKVTYVAVANLSGLSRSQLYKAYSHLIRPRRVDVVVFSAQVSSSSRLHPRRELHQPEGARQRASTGITLGRTTIPLSPESVSLILLQGMSESGPCSVHSEESPNWMEL